jgi:hypothetical protein
MTKPANTPSKLAYRLQNAFKAAKTTGQPQLEQLPSGLNCKLRFTTEGTREILCFRSGITPPGDLELETVAKHAGFSAWDIEHGSSKTGTLWAIISEITFDAEPDQDQTPPWDLPSVETAIKSTPDPQDTLSPTERSILLERLVTHAFHLAPDGVAMRRAYLTGLNNAEFISDAKNIAGGSIWLEFQASRAEIRSNEDAFNALGREVSEHGLFSDAELEVSA